MSSGSETLDMCFVYLLTTRSCKPFSKQRRRNSIVIGIIIIRVRIKSMYLIICSYKQEPDSHLDSFATCRATKVQSLLFFILTRPSNPTNNVV